MANIRLVTGANGHLGNNLVRELLEQGETVRAGVRNANNTIQFDGLDCQLIEADMLDQTSMEKALEGVDVLYHVAAVFKHWAKDPETEIVQANIQGTEIVLSAAAKANVKKVVYVSSVAAIGHDGSLLTEESWNDDISNPYYRSKIESEKRAWELAKQYNLWMVAVLPSAMVGPNIDRLTDTMQFIENIRTGALAINPSFFFNFVDPRDVAKGMIAASEKGKSGERYILANDRSSSLEDIINAAESIALKVQKPPVVPKWLLYVLSGLMGFGSKLTGKPAELISSQVSMFFNVKQEYNISKARTELGYNPKSSHDALVETFKYLEQR
ncbi:nucleoside-diphosphate sugar epimerase [Marinomonas ushuaiensis DSM 15871]|uniref:Nucleoside-diphosphate sugar epimerase n=1 Tax=Marinomonas ushuaiensis DSM 15871 TaxID=1122207 RepID=X7EAL9_9GAMM|nr:NAD-dependent epimerase/dehydratase family protein [Marinomonas ushuaiensis]ETX12178.1 nucleoside-diphosphate sugar epimerase [Marinomonas ushuaiensis DSM 15871]